jgi:cell division transport system ATP-binding protein
MIRLTSVSKYYPGKIPGIVDLSLEIPDGEFVFLIGPSGSGKTTILRLLIRDLVPTTGTILIDDWDLGKLNHSNLHHLRRKVGTVYQDFKLLLDRTVYENVAMVLEILGKPEKEIKHAVTNVLELVGLADKQNLFPMQLSAGEMQRAGIARAIVGGPKILLADEPTGNLDPETAWGIIDILEEINALGTTIIMASHNADIVNKLKKRTLTVEHGHVVRDEEKGHYHLMKHEKKETKGGKHDAAH